MTVSPKRLALLSILAATLLAFGGFSPNGQAAPLAGIKLKTASADLPQDFDQMFPDGPDVDVVNTNCRACHSPSMVLVQPKLSKPAWEKVVTKMITAYHAPIAAGDVPRIVNYLEGIKF